MADNPYVQQQAMADTEVAYGEQATDIPVYPEDNGPSIVGEPLAKELASHVGITALTQGKDGVEAAESTYNQLLSGSHTQVQEATAASSVPTKAGLVQDALTMLSLGYLSPEETIKYRKQYKDNKLSGDIVANNAANIASAEPSANVDQEDVLDARYRMEQEDATASLGIQTLLDKFAAANNDSMSKAMYDSVKTIALPETTAVTSQVIDYMASRGWMQTSATDYIAAGSNIKQIIARGNKLAPELKTQYFKDFLDGLAKATSLLGGTNGMSAYHLSTAVAEHMQQGTLPAGWVTALQNIDLLNIPGLTTAGVGIFRVGKKIVTASGSIIPALSMPAKSAVGSLAQAAPNTAPAILAHLATNPKAAAAANTSAEDLILAYGIPKASEYDLTSAPVNLIEGIEAARVHGNVAIERTANTTYLLDDTGKEASIQLAMKEAKAKAAVLPELHVANQVYSATDEGFLLQNLYGNGTTGFARRSQAMDSALNTGLFDTNSPTFEIVSLNPRTKQLKVEYTGGTASKAYKDAADGKEYFIRTSAVGKYDPMFATAVAPADAPRIGLLTRLIAAFSKSMTTFRSVEAVLPREMAKAVTANYTARVALENNLKDLASGYHTLSDGSKSRVMHAVVEGANYSDVSGQTIGKTFSYNELALKGFSEKEILGYFQLRELAHTTHAIRNRALRMELESGNYKRFVDEASGFDDLGREIQASEINALDAPEVFDTATGVPRKLSGAQLIDEYGKGNTLIQLKNTKKVGWDKYEYALVKDVNSSKRELPQTLLGRVEGYYGPTIYRENVFVEATNVGMRVNGRVIPAGDPRTISVIAAARTVEEAKKIISDLGANPGVSYRAKYGRELHNKLDEAAHDEITGHLYNSRRGEQLTGYQQRTARILEPARAMEVNKNNIAKLTHADQLIAQLEASWTGAYSKYSSTSKFPLDRTGMAANDIVGTKDEFTKAQAMFDLIDGYKHVGEENQVYRNLSGEVAQWLDPAVDGLHNGGFVARFRNSRLGKAAAEKAASAAYTSAREGISPLSRLKSLGFIYTIATHPLRQIYLQAIQHGYLASLNPKHLSKAYAQASGEAAYRAANAAGRGDAWEIGAKIAGMKTDEFRNLILGFETSGLKAQINSHSSISNTLRPNQATLWDGANAGYFVDKGIDMFFRKPIGALREVGFNRGEVINQKMTNFFAYNSLVEKYKRPIDFFNAKEAADVIGETNLLTFNMTGAGEHGIQKGALRSVAQFMSFQIKAMQNIVGATKTFTPEQRRRMAAVTLVMWGAGGFGLRKVYEELKVKNNIQPNELVDEAISGGLAETALNHATTAMFSDDKDMQDRLAWAENSSPFSGVLFWSMLDANAPVYEALLGASGQTGKKLYEHMSYAGRLLLHQKGFTTADTAASVAKELGSILPLVSATTKSYLGMHYKELYDKSGDPKVRVTSAEALAMLAGFYPVRATQKDIKFSALMDEMADLKADGQMYAKLLYSMIGTPSQGLPQGQIRLNAIADVLSTVPEDRLDIMRAELSRALSLKSYKEQGDVLLLFNKLAGATGADEMRDYINAQPNEEFKNDLLDAAHLSGE